MRLDAQAAQQGLEALPLEQREAVILKIWGQLNFAQAAEVAGIAVHDLSALPRGIEVLAEKPGETMSNEGINRERELEELLVGLRPAPGPERERVMFAAGYQAGQIDCGLLAPDGGVSVRGPVHRRASILGQDAQATKNPKSKIQNLKSKFWPAVAAVLALGLIVSLATRPGEVAPAEKIVYLERPRATGPELALKNPPSAGGGAKAENAFNYLKLQRAVLERGVDALPQNRGGSGDKPLRLNDLLHNDLNS